MGLRSEKTPVLDVARLRPGDHICYPTSYVSIAYHHAIVTRVINESEIEVIHYSGPPEDDEASSSSSNSVSSIRFSSSKKDADIAIIRKDKVNLSKFAKDGKLFRVDYENDDNCYSPDYVVMRAESKVGQFGLQKCGYDLLRNNCEHFASWCKTGEAFSLQSCLK